MKDAVWTVEDPSDSMHLIKHYYDIWIVVLSLFTVNVWLLALVKEAWGQSAVSASFLNKQVLKSQVVRGRLNISVDVFVSKKLSVREP